MIRAKIIKMKINNSNKNKAKSFKHIKKIDNSLNQTERD